MSKNPKMPRIFESLNALWGIAMAITLAAASVSLSWSEFAALLRVDHVHFILSTLLAIVTFGLFCAYAIATHSELNLFNDYLGESVIPRVKPRIYVLTFALAILFGTLIALSRNLLAYSAVMVTYNLFDLWGNWELGRHIGPPLEKQLQAEQNEEQKEALQIMKDFYFGNPTLPRIVTIMFVNWIVILLALAHIHTGTEVLRTSGYVLLLANITLGEIVVHRWRWRSIYKL
jgi:hypothetical protein